MGFWIRFEEVNLAKYYEPKLRYAIRSSVWNKAFAEIRRITDLATFDDTIINGVSQNLTYITILHRYFTNLPKDRK
jgi:hypothetical protein